MTGNITEDQRLGTRADFMDWLRGVDPRRMFNGGSCANCALAVYTDLEVLISTYGPEGDEYKLPRWALRFNRWANEQGRLLRPFTAAKALQAIKRGYR